MYVHEISVPYFIGSEVQFSKSALGPYLGGTQSIS